MRTSVRASGEDSVTSDGHPYARFRRALGGTSVTMIRAAAADLGHVSLEDGLAICLAFLDLEPATFPRAASRWAARFTLERKLTTVESQLALAALAALDGPAARAGAEALIELSTQHRLSRIDLLLGDWLDRKGLGD
jgi:hypothetical protein